MRPTDVLSIFVPPFSELGAEWMVVGGIAAIIYGEPRFTQDIDLVARLSRAQGARIPLAFPADQFYAPPPEAVALEVGRPSHGHFNLLHHETGARADVYLVGDNALSAWGLERRRVVSVLGIDVPIAAPEYVILYKLRFRKDGASERHLRDVRAMLRVLGDAVDQKQLQGDALAQGLGAQWDEMLRLRE